ncbi:MAG: hypothetical protein GOU98_02035 [Candidatus Altiarchaeota archaeon]|nr:hypothetical protein [Candidatus Altiarchaeota archaeon]
MDFNIVGTAIVLLLSLSLIGMALYRMTFSPEDKTLDSIIQSAGEGRADRIFLTPDNDFDVCEYLGWSSSCELEYGVIEFCELYGGTSYEIRALPNNPGVCLNITETT